MAWIMRAVILIVAMVLASVWRTSEKAHAVAMGIPVVPSKSVLEPAQEAIAAVAQEGDATGNWQCRPPLVVELDALPSHDKT